MFDGQGNLTQRDYQGDNLAGPDFSPVGQETGTYQVNSDCTGSMTINLNVPNVPSGTSSGVIDIMFVISDGAVISPKSSRKPLRRALPDPCIPRKPAPTTGRLRRSGMTEASFATQEQL